MTRNKREYMISASKLKMLIETRGALVKILKQALDAVMLYEEKEKMINKLVVFINKENKKFEDELSKVQK